MSFGSRIKTCRLVFMLAIASMISLFSSCSPEPNDIYWCGNSFDGHAYLSMHGRTLELSGPECILAHVSCMKMIGNDVYCAGWVTCKTPPYDLDVPVVSYLENPIKEGYRHIACYWENGRFFPLDNEPRSSGVSDMTIRKDGTIAFSGWSESVIQLRYKSPISNDKIGVRQSVASLWIGHPRKHFRFVPLSDGSANSSALTVCADSDDVLHVGGYDQGMLLSEPYLPPSKEVKHYWIYNNGIISHESFDGVIRGDGRITKIFKAKDDLIICGWSGGVDGHDPFFVKDGMLRKPKGYIYQITDGCYENSGWYICGYSSASCGPGMVYHKNGQVVKEVNQFKEGKSASYAVSVSGQDVYLAGVRKDIAGYWKNGKFKDVKLGHQGELTGIIVKPKIK